MRLCSPKVAFAVATVGNRSQPSATSLRECRERCRKASQKYVQLTHVAVVILAFAEEVSVSGICGARVLLAFAKEVSVSSKSVLQECQERVSYKSVK